MKSVSFVIPCLNEERTLPLVLEKIARLRSNELSTRPTEIIVSDNGSIDRSVEIAESFGARVENCAIRGYGAALKNGISSARNEIIIFADADATYDFSESILLINEIEKGYDLVIGSRLKGDIHSGAMPFLHRFVGTPILTCLINFLYHRDGIKISDCNSGFRCFRKESYDQWNIQSNGMEFASEMLVKALKTRAKISEVPVSLYPDQPDRKPHLRTWRDGMRHVLRIFVDAPFFFAGLGAAVFALSWALLLAGILLGQINGAPASPTGISLMLLALAGSVLGQTVWSTGLFILVGDRSNQGLLGKIIRLPEEKLMRLILGILSVSLLSFGAILFYWIRFDFGELAHLRQVLVFLTILVDGLVASIHLFGAHLLKRISHSSQSKSTL